VRSAKETNHEHRKQERGDLRDGVLDDGDRQVRAPLEGQHQAGGVLHGIAGDRDDHQAGERL